jgi:hypothetical protein
MTRRNGSLDPRRWQTWRAERDDLPLFDERLAENQKLKTLKTTVCTSDTEAVSVLASCAPSSAPRRYRR